MFATIDESTDSSLGAVSRSETRTIEPFSIFSSSSTFSAISSPAEIFVPALKPPPHGLSG